MKVKVNYQSDIDIPEWLIKELDGNKILAKLLYRRGINTPAELRQFLDPEEYSPIKPGEIPNLRKGVEFILAAVKEGKKICVYGDYDVDGVTSTTILVKTLEEIGGEVIHHIPDRFEEGYGLDEGVVRGLAEEGIDLLLTCDCGISNHHEIKLAKELGLEVVVTDHHQLPEELPRADCIISAKLLPKDHQAYYLPGAGTAYYLASALLTEEGKEGLINKLLEFVALAVVADVVPLRGENRYLLKKGLETLATTNWVGIEELCGVCEIDPFNLAEEEIGFQLAPRINAAGRIDNACKAVELLLSKDKKEAEELAKELDQINSRRKELSNKMETEAFKLLEDVSLEEPIILYQAHWHEGILGIAAGRLTEKFQVPALLMGLKEDGETITGSARSIPGIHINDNLKECADILSNFGGHEGAAGFSLPKEKLTQFKDKLQQVLKRRLTKLGKVREIEVDDKLALAEIDLDFYTELRKLAPFGEGNPEPLFYSSGIEVVSSRSFGDDKHLGLTLEGKNERHSAVWWRADEEKIGEQVDIVYSLGINNWRGKKEIQLVIQDVVEKEGDLEERKIDFKLEDWRNWRELGDSLPEFKQPLYYYEGLKEWELDNLINRYQGGKTETLVLLSCPPELEIIKDLIQRTEPKKVVLAYSSLEIGSKKEFINQLAGLVKNIIKERQGKANIYQLASLTAEKEITVSLGLKYLQAKGFIELEFIGPANILIERGDNKQNQDQKLKGRLFKLLRESRAFREYMQESELENIERLL